MRNELNLNSVPVTFASENTENTLVDSQCFEKNAIDCFEEGNNLWFKLSDIASLLEVDKATASKWKTWADDDEIKLRKTQLGGHAIPYGSESLLYRILNRSNSPKANPFERLVTIGGLCTVRTLVL